MNDPILPDLPAGFYLALIDVEFPKVYMRHADGWNDDQGDDCADPRSEWHVLTLHPIPALLSAAGERDALRAAFAAHKGAANKLRSDLAAEVRRLRAELAEARAVLIVIERNALSCPICCMHFRSGHSHGCAFAAALAKAKS